MLSRKSELLILWIGFGLFFITYSGGPVGTFIESSGSMRQWDYSLIVQLLFFSGVFLGFVFLTYGPRQVAARLSSLGPCAAAYVAITALSSLALSFSSTLSPQLETMAQAALSLVAGFIYAMPLFLWLKRLLHIGQACTQFEFFIALIPCYLLSVLGGALIFLLPDIPYSNSILLTLCSLTSVACLYLSRTWKETRDRSPLVERGEKYRPAPYAVAVLACLGFADGTAMSGSLVAIKLETSANMANNMLAASAITLIFVIFILANRRKESVKFGSLIRFAIAFNGICFLLLPLVMEVAPQLLYMLLNPVMMMCEFSLLIFSNDISREKSIPFLNVLTPHGAVFLAGCIAAVLLFSLSLSFGDRMAWQIISISAVALALVVMGILPKRFSSAASFTVRSLSEAGEEGQTLASRCKPLSQKYGLTPAETTVLGYLLEGLDREQIADILCLSPHTIKGRISSVYRKCDIHSYNELIKLAIQEGR